jgi:hypothetical protein
MFPASAKESAAIDAGRERSLPDAAAIEGGGGCEHFTAVFSERPLSLPDLSDRVAKSVPSADCRLQLEVPGAVSVRVVEVRVSVKE